MSKTLSLYSFGIKRSLFLFLYLLFAFDSTFAQNAIVTENALPGNPISEWGVTSSADFRNVNLNGYATDISVNKGSTVHFKIDGQAGVPFTIKIYRMGYYGGLGARFQADLGSFPGIKQPAGTSDPVTGLVDCGNWTESASWLVPATAVSGFYIVKLQSAGGINNIVFIVRDDASTSKIFFQANDATWQAYNAYGGSNVYNGTTGFPSGHAVKVSYNRPFFIYNTGFLTNNFGSDWYMNDSYPMIRWLERNGYDMSYTTNVDVARSGGLLLNHKIFVTNGHDEYWSKEQRDAVEAARNAGVNLAFFSGNEVYWKTRWEADGSGTNFRTMVCYKEGLLADGSQGEATCGFKCDVSAPTVWTGLWRTGQAFDAPLPENALTGQISWDGTAGAIQVPDSYKNLRLWRNTSVALLAAGQTATLAPNTLGYEWDYEQFPATYPPARITMSKTVLNGHTHKLSLYKYYPSGALVFGAGTVQWGWGLDDQHFGGTGNLVSKDMQQATVNLFADMGVQPGSLQSDLVAAAASTDVTPPVSVITTPVNGSSIPAADMVTISGTATDAGGAVAGVEVSVDGGLTWQPATGTNNWTFSWNPLSPGTYTIKSRAFDDSGNLEDASGSTGTNIITVTLTPAVCPCHIFTTQIPVAGTSNDNAISGKTGLEVGLKFQSSEAGFITGIRFYKTTGNTGTHTGELYSSAGARLAQAVFTNETATGWQSVSFSNPVAIAANTTYVAAYFSASGNYTEDNNYFFGNSVINSPLIALANGTDGPNAPFVYSNAPAFPDQFFHSANYWVDVTYTHTSDPTAFAGNNQTINLPTTTVTLDGSGSTGTISDYLWTFVSGPNTPVITTPTTVTTTVTGLVLGTYVFQLAINGGTSTSQVTIIVNPPVPPTANAGPNQTITLPLSTVTLNGSASTGTITDYTWTRVSGPNTPTITSPNTVSTTVTGLVQGTYVFQLSLNSGASTAQVTIIVNPVPPPTANAGINQTLTLPTSSTTLNGSGSTGTITDYTWTFVSGPNTPAIATPLAVSTNISGLIHGIYVFQLSVNSGVSTSLVTVYVINAGEAITIFTTQTPTEVTGNDGQGGIELGVKFRSSAAGFITGVRFYKTTGNTGTHIGDLFAADGTLLSEATFGGESNTGWQEVFFNTPVAIIPNTTYIAAYFSSLGNYVGTPDYFITAVVNGPLTALADGTDGPNGIFKYTPAPSFPNSISSGGAPNYWVDAIFTEGSEPLPVVYLNFSASRQGDDIKLIWTTANEQNNKGFEIQRSTNNSSWTPIGFVAGVGNSQISVNYQYIDKDLPEGTYYYRLRQIDYDGNSQISKVVQVGFGSELSLELMQNRPNPFNNSTIINFVIPKSGRVQLLLYDQMGKPVQQIMDEFKMPGTYNVQVNRNGLSSGIYYYKLNALGQTIVRKMTIL
jgi:hypothetical protein